MPVVQQTRTRRDHTGGVICKEKSVGFIRLLLKAAQSSTDIPQFSRNSHVSSWKRYLSWYKPCSLIYCCYRTKILLGMMAEQNSSNTSTPRDATESLLLCAHNENPWKVVGINLGLRHQWETQSSEDGISRRRPEGKSPVCSFETQDLRELVHKGRISLQTEQPRRHSPGTKRCFHYKEHIPNKNWRNSTWTHSLFQKDTRNNHKFQIARSGSPGKLKPEKSKCLGISLRTGAGLVPANI